MSNGDFVNGIIPKESKLDWVVLNMSVKVEELQNFLKSKEQFAKDNDGWINIDVLRSKNDQSKIYCKFSTWKPKTRQVSSGEHQPDRELDDVPF